MAYNYQNTPFPNTHTMGVHVYVYRPGCMTDERACECVYFLGSWVAELLGWRTLSRWVRVRFSSVSSSFLQSRSRAIVPLRQCVSSCACLRHTHIISFDPDWDLWNRSLEVPVGACLPSSIFLSIFHLPLCHSSPFTFVHSNQLILACHSMYSEKAILCCQNASN